MISSGWVGCFSVAEYFCRIAADDGIVGHRARHNGTRADDHAVADAAHFAEDYHTLANPYIVADHKLRCRQLTLLADRLRQVGEPVPSAKNKYVGSHHHVVANAKPRLLHVEVRPQGRVLSYVQVGTLAEIGAFAYTALFTYRENPSACQYSERSA